MKAISRQYGKAAVHRNRHAGTYRKTSIVVGMLFLTSTAAFMAGSRLIASFFSGDKRRSSGLLTGVLLEGYCGLAVAGIGVAMLPLLNPYDGYEASEALGRSIGLIIPPHRVGEERRILETISSGEKVDH